jgi:hypothetical protein
MMSANLGFVPHQPEKIQVNCRWKPARNFSENNKGSVGYALALRRFLPIPVMKSW